MCLIAAYVQGCTYMLLFCTDVITSFSRQYLIEKLPKILLLHLGRDDDKGRVDDRHISFPLILDIAPYCCNTEVRFILTLYSHTFRELLNVLT